MSSSSVSVHRPVVAGLRYCGATPCSSTHSSEDTINGITHVETRYFRDAGEMRGEAEGKRDDVNQCATDTIEAGGAE